MVTKTNRENMQKPDWMNDEEWAWFKERTASLELIRSDAHADVEAYLADPAGRSTGQNAQGGFPTLLLTTIGRKTGKQRTTPAVFMRDGEDMIVVGSLAGYDQHPSWIMNLQANPNCWVQLDFDKYAAVARDVTTEEREALWPRLVKVFPAWGYFQMQTERPFAVKRLTVSAPA
ncbi:hypothetical protein ACG33_12460 [Steroidobacter denitrificans]|uniref:Nitroreductase n=1 Tax=Steroidobacter denitrificans TaxID=465721 RepID=A0A127FBW0_STEDE|nr:nitroreductase/quinone reductase family protein [Steroidobacter denitrificans]AMN47894.1 hypothetical protein ACG33_12460 [Steroidobacter denitrificans]